MGLVALQHVGSSRTRDQTHVPCVGGRILNHWTTRVALYFSFQIQVQHPAAKSMIEISRTQDEEVGDGTTSVIILGKKRMEG